MYARSSLTAAQASRLGDPPVCLCSIVPVFSAKATTDAAAPAATAGFRSPPPSLSASLAASLSGVHLGPGGSARVFRRSVSLMGEGDVPPDD